ncbi:MAG: hypothetical protein ACRC1K_04135, partial [Planctomycetia bacterium]
VCTGNSRRSMLGATMGNAAAAYHGLPGVRFHSGGTDPSAFNPRTIRALREIGVEIESTGEEAEPGSAGAPNPKYNVAWGKKNTGFSEWAGTPETVEFSKHYSDPANPAKEFAAVLVCTQADAGCPTVKGATVRIPMPFNDPKEFDGKPEEAAKYAERRDDVGRIMMHILADARRRLDAVGN